MLFLCVNVYCHRVTTQLQLINIIIIIIISSFVKFRPVGSDLFHEDRQADMTKLIVGFRSFANAPKIP